MAWRLLWLVVVSDQEERVVSVEQFVHGRKDVLVATDIASKGLDFPNIQHVINYDMPDDIENYGQLFLTVMWYITPWAWKKPTFLFVTSLKLHNFNAVLHIGWGGWNLYHNVYHPF